MDVPEEKRVAMKKILYKDGEWLYFQYIIYHWSIFALAQLCHCSRGTIRNWLRKFKIPLRIVPTIHLRGHRPSHAKVNINCTHCQKLCRVRLDSLKSSYKPYMCRSCVRKQIKVSSKLEDRIKRGKTHRVYSFNDNLFEKIDSESKAYWLGFLAADGNVSENKISLCLADKDKEHLNCFKTFMGIKTKNYITSKNSEKVSIRSFQMANDLEKYGIIPNKTFSIRLPNLSENMIRHFIRGYFDGDGCICSVIRRTRRESREYVYNGGEFSILGNIKMLRDMLKIFRGLNLPITKLIWRGRKICRLRYGGIRQLKILYDYLYDNANICLIRKKLKFEEILNGGTKSKAA